MPPLKTYKFKHIDNDRIYIIIETYSFEGAYNQLVSITKNPADFIVID